jgi:hypothetical protein
LIEAEKVTVGQLCQYLSRIEGPSSVVEQVTLRAAAGCRE